MAVIPAHAGTFVGDIRCGGSARAIEVPAFAGMTPPFRQSSMPTAVIPAQAGIFVGDIRCRRSARAIEVPAFAGMTPPRGG
jgi:hypothetical protein